MDMDNVFGNMSLQESAQKKKLFFLLSDMYYVTMSTTLMTPAPS